MLFPAFIRQEAAIDGTTATQAQTVRYIYPPQGGTVRRKILTVLSLLIMISLVATPAAAGGNGDGLKPGQFVVLEQKVPINLVFVGFTAASIDEDDLLGGLPDTYEPVVRYPQFYGLPGRDMGLKFNFKYRVRFARPEFDNAFFNYLAQAGDPAAPTAFQLAYNDQVNNVLDVGDTVLYIDAPSTERWLENHARSMLGIDTEESYTIFFVNWYARPDFQFHVYTKTDEADPDTGYNFGVLRGSRKIIAWGGTHGRTWFYDPSAGPESWSGSYDVDNDDLDGDGFADYRIPPIWEYVTGGYRDPSELSADLGLVTRFVAINLLFTSSPLYDPLVTAPGLGGRKIAHIEMFEDDPASNGLDWIRRGFVAKQLRAFQPYYDWRVRLEDNAPIDAGAQRALQIFSGVLAQNDCWNAFGTPFAELFCYFDANLSTYVPAYRPNDYVGEIFAFNTTAATLGGQFGLLGFADDNWVDGTQSYVFEFDAAEYRDLGYGFTTTSIHEFGHHIGMSHPHDGYDSELGVDYGPGGSTYFAWSGDESHTIMHYMDLATGFGQFDQDNMYRYETAGYLNWANDLAADVLAHPNAASVAGLLERADDRAEQAKDAFRDWNYRAAVRNAYRPYTLVATAADRLGIPTPTAAASLLSLLPSNAAPHEGDPIRFPDE
jgi:hypothetical protein